MPDTMTKIFQNLTPEEIKLAESWFNRLEEKDGKNIEYVGQTLIDWINGKFDKSIFDESYLKHQFYVLKAIGSTVENTHKQAPKDIDLLVITNHYINTMHLTSPEVKGLVSTLKKKYGLTIDNKLNKSYASHGEEGVKILLNSGKKEIKNIDLTFKYDIISEERWNYNDKLPAVTLFRFGKHRSWDEKVWAGDGWEIAPLADYIRPKCSYS